MPKFSSLLSMNDLQAMQKRYELVFGSDTYTSASVDQAVMLARNDLRSALDEIKNLRTLYAQMLAALAAICLQNSGKYVVGDGYLNMASSVTALNFTKIPEKQETMIEPVYRPSMQLPPPNTP